MRQLPPPPPRKTAHVVQAARAGGEYGVARGSGGGAEVLGAAYGTRP
jgi:hypothetical protein